MFQLINTKLDTEKVEKIFRTMKIAENYKNPLTRRYHEN
jgi:hypothetical protein